MGKVLNNIKRGKRGAVSTIVLFTLLMFVVILMGTYVLVTINARSQLRSDERIKDIYAEDVKKKDEMYEAVMNGWDDTKMVNAPKLLEGMTPIKFITFSELIEGTEKKKDEIGRAVKTSKIDNEWYDYRTKQWANAETEDGSMWVWIPRFAYKIDKENQKIDVVFLIGTTDTYYDSVGIKQEAKRAKNEEKSPDATADYIVHPAFTDESSMDYANGGWSKELTGIWVSKFEAGYAGGNNDSNQADSSVTYSNATRNYFGECTTSTKIKYPVFRPTTYSMNNISIQDAYRISEALTEVNNIYGLNKTKADADSHLIKNSEWGAVAYLAKSSYGNENEITINNANLNDSISTIYAITGCAAESDIAEKTTTISALNGAVENTPVDGLFIWNQEGGQKASTTGNIYGVYDINGGSFEYVAAYVSNGNENIETYGNALKTNSNSKYITTYESTDSANNIIGDAIKETTSGTGNNNNAWNEDNSVYPSTNPFFARGGSYAIGNKAGSFSYTPTQGNPQSGNSFRAVLVAK